MCEYDRNHLLAVPIWDILNSMRTLIVILILLCVMPSAWAGQYEVESLPAQDIALEEGAFAWDPDGARAGWIEGGSVMICDIATQKKTSTVSGGYTHLLWDTAGLYAIKGAASKTSLSMIDPASGNVERTIALGVPVSGIYSSGNGGEVILLWESFVRSKLGMDVNYALYALDLKSGKLDRKFSDYRIGFGRNMDARYYRGWAGVSPMESKALLLDYISPPALRSYMRFTMVDYLQKGRVDIARSDILEITSHASWSPDGRRVAFAVDGAGLAIIDIDDGALVVQEGLSGLWPAWSPAGDKLYFGGALISPDDASREEILSSAVRTIGWWSPDGTMLAVADGKGALRLISGFAPSDSGMKPDTRQKLLDLKGLLIDGLISQDEYNIRRDRLLGGAGRGKQ